MSKNRGKRFQEPTAIQKSQKNASLIEISPIASIEATKKTHPVTSSSENKPRSPINSMNKIERSSSAMSRGENKTNLK